ncbi:MAG: hypothetical protein IPN47_13020 [Gemmatimonadetes bacterium]|nr:hypothetical protein [Gemmatimonadota bacterium]
MAPDGVLWFSDASQRWDTRTGGLMDFWESRPTGRLLRHDPRVGDARRPRLDRLRQRCRGGSRGRPALLNRNDGGAHHTVLDHGAACRNARDLSLEGLPGLPDNIGCDGHGLFWWRCMPRVPPRSTHPRLAAVASQGDLSHPRATAPHRGRSLRDDPRIDTLDRCATIRRTPVAAWTPPPPRWR